MLADGKAIDAGHHDIQNGDRKAVALLIKDTDGILAAADIHDLVAAALQIDDLKSRMASSSSQMRILRGAAISFTSCVLVFWEPHGGELRYFFRLLVLLGEGIAISRRRAATQ